MLADYMCHVACALSPGRAAPPDCEPFDFDDYEFDFPCFIDSFTGSGGEVLAGCEELDFDEDGDVDLVDYGVFQQLVSP